MYCVYRITNRLNGKTYIGITKDFAKRMRQHVHSSRYNKYNKYAFARAIRKYGWHNFNTQILIDNVSYQDAQLMEMLCIASENSTIHGNGYNMSAGGESPLNPLTMHGYSYKNVYAILGVSNSHEYNSIMGKRYRMAHHSDIIKREAEYRATNKSIIKERKKIWYEHNKEKVKARHLEYKTNNYDKVLESKRKYRNKTRDIRNFVRNERRAQLRMLRMCAYFNNH